MTAPTIYQPKGSMCIECKHVAEDCSRLDFKSMQPIERLKKGANTVVAVRCIKYEKKKTAMSFEQDF